MFFHGNLCPNFLKVGPQIEVKHNYLEPNHVSTPKKLSTTESYVDTYMAKENKSK